MNVTLFSNSYRLIPPSCFDKIGEWSDHPHLSSIIGRSKGYKGKRFTGCANRFLKAATFDRRSVIDHPQRRIWRGLVHSVGAWSMASSFSASAVSVGHEDR